MVDGLALSWLILTVPVRWLGASNLLVWNLRTASMSNNGKSKVWSEFGNLELKMLVAQSTLEFAALLFQSLFHVH